MLPRVQVVHEGRAELGELPCGRSTCTGRRQATLRWERVFWKHQNIAEFGNDVATEILVANFGKAWKA